MDLQWDELIVPNPSDVQIFNMGYYMYMVDRPFYGPLCR